MSAPKLRTLVYEIFVDRFAGPAGRALDAPPPDAAPWLHHAGGTLDGITARLDHVVALGADALYLTPIFTAPSNHKYDTATFEHVDPAFGGDAAFDRLAAACRARGLGLVLDGVFNHVGATHPWFREAVADPSSPRARFFRFDAHPHDYARWQGHHHLPELDLDREEVLDALFSGEASVLRRWLARGATGFRLDCANDLGLSVCARIAREARDAGATDATIGEVMAFGERWVKEGGLGGVMSYWFREAVVGAARGETPPAQAAENLHVLAERFPFDALVRSWNVLATHDVPRLATLVPDVRAQRFAWILAFAYPGTPLVYYGEELGLEGGRDPDNRGVMPWDRDGHATARLITALAALRRREPALLAGRYVPLRQLGAPSIIAFARTTEHADEALWVVANASDAPVRTRIFAPTSELLEALPLVDRLGDAPETKASMGRFDVALGPWQVALYGADDGRIPGYRFLRRR
ncbi:hypothetical protein L6R52_42765 [Myxococcota bacterium]|nr:hypothetical protein [Myxococcota bacterium]